jgi:hypothetical protein
MNVALGKSRSVMGVAQEYSSIIRSKTEAVSNKVARPVIKVERKVAQADEVIRSLADDIDR